MEIVLFFLIMNQNQFSFEISGIQKKSVFSHLSHRDQGGQSVWQNRWSLADKEGASRVVFKDVKLHSLQLSFVHEIKNRKLSQDLWLRTEKDSWKMVRKKMGVVWKEDLGFSKNLFPFSTGFLPSYFVLQERLRSKNELSIPFFNPERLWMGEMNCVRVTHRNELDHWPFKEAPLLDQLWRIHFRPLCKHVSNIERMAWVEWGDVGPQRLFFPHVGIRMEALSRIRPFSSVRERKRPQITQRLVLWKKMRGGEAIQFKSFDGTLLKGTLRVPQKQKPFVSLVLIHGSGAETRNSGSGYEGRDIERCPAQPFLELARKLSKRGCAVLRYDKRGVGESAGSLEEATLKSLEQDVFSAVEFVRKRISSPVVVLGCSEGARLAFSGIAHGLSVEGMVGISSPARTIDQTFLAKFEKRYQLLGWSRQSIRKQLAPIQDVLGQMRRIAQMDDQKKLDLKYLGHPYAWWVERLREAPFENAKKMSCPLLLLHGGADLEILPSEHEFLCQELSSAGVSFQSQCLPGLNHFLTKSQKIYPGYEYDVPQEFSNSALKVLAGWLEKNWKKRI